jgi:mannose PTS system EIIA component
VTDEQRSRWACPAREASIQNRDSWFIYIEEAPHMVAAVIVTHGHLAQALLDAARLIVGDLPAVQAVGFEPWDGPDAARAKVERAIEQVDQGEGVLILADLPGGTPCNVGLACIDGRDIEVVTGVNLSMLVRIPAMQAGGPRPLGDLAADLADHGRRSIREASADVRRQEKEP